MLICFCPHSAGEYSTQHFIEKTNVLSCLFPSWVCVCVSMRVYAWVCFCCCCCCTVTFPRLYAFKEFRWIKLRLNVDKFYTCSVLNISINQYSFLSTIGSVENVCNLSTQYPSDSFLCCSFHDTFPNVSDFNVRLSIKRKIVKTQATPKTNLIAQ